MKKKIHTHFLVSGAQWYYVELIYWQLKWAPGAATTDQGK